MRLNDYLISIDESPADFARRVKLSAVAIHRYIHKGRVPDREAMPKIVEGSGGKVTPNDFYMAPRSRRPSSRRRQA